MICSLDELFTLFANDNMPLPPAAVSDSLFAETTKTTDRRLSDSWLGVISGLYTDEARNLSALPDTARRLFELSVNAFDAVIHAWMSELPVEPELLRFGRKTLAAPDRITAGNTAADRGDSDVHTVLKAADIVRHEV
ncbi:MAG: hypothetical protein LBD48_14740, partial [Treponema sp.]|nr:hypothetical protein [Treponema sp.]